ncbi:hypothetical protein AFM12_14030 [Jiulongibacter sediminis]|uniref:Uncharacterized protein n=1 Tax=Jiulongibacter sediminis TaxID=1605367 RepID=A0A0P7BZF4_9BACT|nr:hypothetical protein AFM12_14030 [Jiulongibacter sediminis]TBX23401.1 hypothetical protein TK44_14040 [Jiulongibacter sediminis]
MKKRVSTGLKLYQNIGGLKKLKHIYYDKARANEKEARFPNITYTQAGVSSFVGRESGKFEIQFIVGSSVVKIPACV